MPERVQEKQKEIDVKHITLGLCAIKQAGQGGSLSPHLR
jgi:hypothetical protein